MRSFILVMSLLLAGCNQNSVRVNDAPLNQEFTLKIGEQASVDNGSIYIRFTKVVEDSRCPINARCVWAGNGKISLEVHKPNSEKVTITLNTTLEPQAETYDSYEIQLKQLMPEKVAGSEIKSEEYRATLVMTKK